MMPQRPRWSQITGYSHAAGAQLAELVRAPPRARQPAARGLEPGRLQAARPAEASVEFVGVMGEDHTPLDIHVPRERVESEFGSHLCRLQRCQLQTDVVVGSTFISHRCICRLGVHRLAFSRVVKLVRVHHDESRPP